MSGSYKTALVQISATDPHHSLIAGDEMCEGRERGDAICHETCNVRQDGSAGAGAGGLSYVHQSPLSALSGWIFTQRFIAVIFGPFPGYTAFCSRTRVSRRS